MTELWKTFYNKTTGEEYASYTLRGTFQGEEDATAELIAAEHGIDRADIATRISPRPVGTHKEPTEEAAAALERLEDDIYNDYGVNSKPAGGLWLYMVLDMARRILDEGGLLEAITPEDLDTLTAGNFHTARHAAEVLLQLKHYVI